MNPIFFVHIPKTGGQTLATRIASAFAPERTHILRDDLRYPEDVPLVSALAAEKNFVESHIAGPVLADASAFNFMTAIREPVSRLVSSYRHICREPRDRLHRAALSMTPKDFFANFSDIFSNHQLRYLAHAFHMQSSEVLIRNEYSRWLMDHFWGTLDRLEWITTTEAIDEFTWLWGLENERVLSQPALSINLAPRDKIDTRAVREAILALPELISLDLELWHQAKARHAKFKRRVFLKGKDLATDAVLAWRHEESAIWLTEGWYAPLTHGDGTMEWWAGPLSTSNIVINRTGADTTLSLQLAVLIGLAPQNIHFYSDDLKRLPTETENDTMRVDISSLPLGRSTIHVSVPEVYSAIQFSETDTDPSRRSFSAKNWHFAGKPEIFSRAQPGEVVDALANRVKTVVDVS